MNEDLKRVSSKFKGNNLSINTDETIWNILNPTSKKRFMPK